MIPWRLFIFARSPTRTLGPEPDVRAKMSLSSAEGMMDMINAESDAEIRAGYNLLSGSLSKLATHAQTELTDILSEIEVSFDYPEETIEYVTKKTVKDRLVLLNEKISFFPHV